MTIERTDVCFSHSAYVGKADRADDAALPHHQRVLISAVDGLSRISGVPYRGANAQPALIVISTHAGAD
jgi:hypothetical protein